MVRLDRHIQEAVQIVSPHSNSPSRQLSLGLTPCLVSSLGFLQVCQLADTTRRAISHQYRMVYREEFNLWYATPESYLRDRRVPPSIRSFLIDDFWNGHPPQADQYWFPSMHEVVFLTYIIEERGYPVWTSERCDSFYYLRITNRTRSARRPRNRAELRQEFIPCPQLFTPPFSRNQ